MPLVLTAYRPVHKYPGPGRQCSLFGTSGRPEPEAVGLRVAAWQATALAAAALVIGLPLGVLAGRWAWAVFAGSAGVSAVADVPAPLVLLAVPATLALANLIAAGPGWNAAQGRPASVLRTELFRAEDRRRAQPATNRPARNARTFAATLHRNHPEQVDRHAAARLTGAAFVTPIRRGRRYHDQAKSAPAVNVLAAYRTRTAHRYAETQRPHFGMCGRRISPVAALRLMVPPGPGAAVAWLRLWWGPGVSSRQAWCRPSA